MLSANSLPRALLKVGRQSSTLAALPHYQPPAWENAANYFDSVLNSGAADFMQTSSPSPSEFLISKLRDCMRKGSLVPDSIVQQALNKRLQLSDSMQRGFVLDGFPRSASQAEALIASAAAPEVVVELAIDDTDAMDRIANRGEGRADDTSPEAVQRRLAQYDAERSAILKVLGRSARVEVVASAGRSAEDIAEDVRACVGAARKVVLTGRAGSGKSVHGRILMRGCGDGAPGPVHLSTGELLRQLVSPVTGFAAIV